MCTKAKRLGRQVGLAHYLLYLFSNEWRPAAVPAAGKECFQMSGDLLQCLLLGRKGGECTESDALQVCENRKGTHKHTQT